MWNEVKHAEKTSRAKEGNEMGTRVNIKGGEGRGSRRKKRDGPTSRVRGRDGGRPDESGCN